MPAEPPVVTPTSLDEAFALLAGGPQRPIAGGTDLMVQITGEIGPVPERILDLGRLEALGGIELDGDALVIGATTTWTAIRHSALCTSTLRRWWRRPPPSAPPRSRTGARSAATSPMPRRLATACPSSWPWTRVVVWRSARRAGGAV